MSTSRRITFAVVVFFLLAGAAFAAYWYQTSRPTPAPATNGVVVNVTQAGDRGPGTLREALFIAASAEGKTTVSITVPKIVLASALPPLVNSKGMSIVAGQGGAEIDASAIGNAPVFDVAGTNISIRGITIRNCPAAGVLLRATRFRLEQVTLEGCDVGVDVAENAGETLIESSRFSGNRVGVRFAASTRDTNVVKNEFIGHKDAAIWAVRSAADSRDPSITVRDNRFSKEPIGVLAGNVAMLIERNEFRDSVNAAVQVIGEGAVVRANRISGGGSMGIVAENARGAIVDENELDHLSAYGIMVKTSSNTLLRGNRMHNCGYGMAFVLGDAANPSSAVENTIIEPRYNGIDIVGDSPILRRNRVLRPRVKALNVSDFAGQDGRTVRAKPFLDNTTFGPGAATVASEAPAAAPSTSR
jgi:parallel beta-helix repeat protein